MNRKMISYTVGKITALEAILLLLPAAVALYYRESCIFPILISAAVSAAVGGLLLLLSKPKDKTIYAKDGFMITALAWIILSAIGALPFFISGEIPNYIDAFFETVSGFTTTGASILADIEKMSRGLLFWRSFTHWIGGMGVLVLMVALFPSDSGRSIHILRAEMPGPIVGKLVPKAKNTAKILYLIYIVLTVLQMVILFTGGMPLFDSVVLSFGTAGTGGFGIRADSVASYSPYLQNVITVFMVLFGINFNIFYLILIRRVKSVFKNTELWCYLGLFAVATALIAVNIYPMYNSVGDAVRLSAFQTASIMSTTGYATANFDLWPGLSRSIILLLMFIGASAGSTAGGLKVSRVIMLLKTMRKDLKYRLHPKTVSVVRYEGKTLDKATARGVGSYFILYAVLFVIVFFILSFEPFSMETNISAAASCINNVGPGLGSVGPALSYAGYSWFSKIVLSLAMLFGRLELYPMLFLLTPTIWKKNS